MKKTLLLTAVLISQSSLVMAAQVTGSGELGATLTSGNTDVSTVNAKLSADYPLSADWSSNTKFNAVSSSTSGVQSAEKYDFSFQADHKKSNNPYYFGNLTMTSDRYIDNRLTTSLTGGVAYSIRSDKKVTLKTQAGFGYRSKQDNARVETADGVITLALNYANKVTDNTTVTTDINIETGANDTITKADLGVKVDMAKAMAVKYNLNLQNNTQVSAGFKNTDIIQTVNLVYGF